MSKEIIRCIRNTERWHRQIHCHGTCRQLPAQRERTTMSPSWTATTRSTASTGCANTKWGLSTAALYFKALACDHFRRIKKERLHRSSKAMR